MPSPFPGMDSYLEASTVWIYLRGGDRFPWRTERSVASDVCRSADSDGHLRSASGRRESPPRDYEVSSERMRPSISARPPWTMRSWARAAKSLAAAR